MEPTTYLYKRPNHSIIRVVDTDKDTGTPIVKAEHYVSAFTGIDLAVRSVSMSGGKIADALRIIRKLEKASHRDVNLHSLYVEFTAHEKKIIETSALEFDWSKFCASNNTNIWINWLLFLEGFVEGTETHLKTWIPFDPKDPPAEYATWLLEHEKRIQAYDAEVRAATEAAAKKEATKTPGSANEGSTEQSGVVESEFTPAS